MAVERRAGAFLAGRRARVAGLLAAARLLPDFFVDLVFFTLAFFAAVFVFRGVFFLPADFLDAFLAGAFFLATVFFLTTVFFLVAFFLRATFLAADFFFATFLRAGAFLRLVDVFFFVTLRFLTAVFFAVPFLDDAFFVARLAVFRFLLAVFFAGMLYSCRTEKRPGLYMAWTAVEARISSNFGGRRVELSFSGDNRFMASIPLNYRQLLGTWLQLTVCDSAKSSSPASNPL